MENSWPTANRQSPILTSEDFARVYGVDVFMFCIAGIKSKASRKFEIQKRLENAKVVAFISGSASLILALIIYVMLKSMHSKGPASLVGPSLGLFQSFNTVIIYIFNTTDTGEYFWTWISRFLRENSAKTRRKLPEMHISWYRYEIHQQSSFCRTSIIIQYMKINLIYF